MNALTVVVIMSPICTAGKFITNIADSAVVLDHQNH